MHKLIILALLISCSTLIQAQTHHERFKNLFATNDTSKIKRLLTEWEKANPHDPELYTSAMNFYFSNSKQEIISVDRQRPNGQGFRLTDSAGAVAGFIGSNLGYKADLLEKIMNYANKGIEKFPNRLDLRFGKCYVLGEIAGYEHFTTEIIKTLEYSNTIKNNWLWTENKKLDDPENFMLGSIQSYLKQLYDTEDDKLLQNMQRIGAIALKYYPSNIEILSTTAVAHMLTKDYEKAIAYLKQAEKLDPKDFIVLNNIAQGYKLKGDKENAIKYYELTEKYGDHQAKQQARQAIKDLKN